MKNKTALVTGVGRKAGIGTAIAERLREAGWISESLREAIKQHTPLGRAGTPRDCAGLVVFLCGPEGGWVNGQVLVANGGAA
ncbi:SDR family oxidoreductase [Amycolatopsis echigonensis]|uniref:SDR family oxidoreductase n=1 Tax=Amycolatopsis echigonensis TaxID=2576905 RepID=UPI001FC91411|nr:MULTISPECIES: SDR family oxidoreductase [Amycolatopsis]